MQRNIKIGRNDLCYCGSSLKYKKCCLVADQGIESDLKTEKIKELFNADPVFLDSSYSKIKMSEMILALAEEYLDSEKTYDGKIAIIGTACLAWNLSLVSEPDRRKILDESLADHSISMNKESRNTIKDMVYSLIDKKLRKYNSIDRAIMNFQCIKMKDHIHLNVMSAVSKKEFESLHTKKENSLATGFKKFKKFFKSLVD